jgi:hypothetical protein
MALDITLATEFGCRGSHNKLATPLNRINPSKAIEMMAINVGRSIKVIADRLHRRDFFQIHLNGGTILRI